MGIIPTPDVPLVDGGGRAAIYWYDYFNSLSLMTTASANISMMNVLDHGVVGDGTTSDAIAINAVMTLASSKGAIVYVPGNRTYNLGSSQVAVPDGVTVMCGLNATLSRTSDPGSAGATWPTFYGSYTGAMISLGNYCRWMGGVLNNAASLGTSASSNTCSVASKTYTVAAGLNIAVGNFIRVQSASAPTSHGEGLVTAYSGTSLTVNLTFASGSGAHTDWTFYAADVFQAAIALHNTTGTVVDQVRITGGWYVGLIFDGWNSPGVPGLNVSGCTVQNSRAEAPLNRGFYYYGSASGCTLHDCIVNGGSGRTDYAFNYNPANPSGNTNLQTDNLTVNCKADGCGFQSYGIGDQVEFHIHSACHATNMTDASGVGFLIAAANGQVPNYNSVSACIAHNCPGEGCYISGSSYNQVDSFKAIVCGTGVFVSPSGGAASENNIMSLLAQGCTTGVNIDTGSGNIYVTGRSTGNGTNLIDNGTGTNSSYLMTT